MPDHRLTLVLTGEEFECLSYAFGVAVGSCLGDHREAKAEQIEQLYNKLAAQARGKKGVAEHERR